MKKLIVIDGQILQTGAWHRGMGKYTMQVLRELNAYASDEFELRVLFNNSIETDGARYEEVKRLCPNIQHHTMVLPVATDNEEEATAYKEALEDGLRGIPAITEKYFLATSLFTFDFFVEFPSGYRSLVLFYDLTPFLFWKDLGGYFPQELYMGRFKKILAADHIFSISETTRQDLLNVFGVSPSKVTNINGGFAEKSGTACKPVSFTAPKNYILFPSGDMPHKNNEVAVRGFGRYAEQHKTEIPLLITSHFGQSSKEKLSSLAKNVIFTENISDEELEWLYENATAVIFASKYEGLGMPILDAVANKKPVITSRIPVFEEMTTTAFYYFDPLNSDELAVKIQEAVSQRGFREKKRQYPGIIQKYTWQKTGSAIMARLNLPTGSTTSPRAANLPKSKDLPRVAVVSLHPGIANQIGRAAEVLYSNLRQAFGVSFFFDANGYHYREIERPTFLNYMDCSVYDISKLDLRSYAQFDLVVYLLDDHAVPSRVAQRACVLPGVVVHSFKKTTKSQNRQHEMLKTLILTNQIGVIPLNKNDTKETSKLTQRLATYIIAATKNHERAIIRKGGSSKKIICNLVNIRKTDV